LINLIAYLKKRVEIEREYNKNMEKNNKAFQAKIKKSVKSSTESLHSNSSDDDINLRLVHNTFNIMLKESMNLIDKNQQNCDTIQNKVITVLQDLLKRKELGYKKKIANLAKIRDEIFKTYGDLERTKQAYDTHEKDSQNQKSKYEDACTEPKGALGTMKNMLRSGDSAQRIEKYHQKWEASQINSANARNEYLLYIDLINLQNDQFYDIDCPTAMKSIDDNYYESMSSIYDMINNLCIDYSNDLNKSISNIQDSIRKINREDDNAMFITQNDIYFKKIEPFTYEPYGSDSISSIIFNESTKHQLSMCLEVFNKQLVTIEQNIDKSNRELQGIEQLIQVYSDKPSFGNAEESINQRNEVLEQLEKLNKDKEIYSTIVNKLKSIGVELERPVIIGSLHKKAIALYNFTAESGDQLSFKENDSITVLEQQGNGWVKAQIGPKIGLVPEEYIKIIDSSNKSLNSTNSTNSLKPITTIKKQVSKTPSNISLSKLNVSSVVALFDYNASDSTELSFKTGDIIEIINTGNNDKEKIENQWWTGRNKTTNKTGQFPVVFTKGWDGSSKSKASKTSSSHQKEKVMKVKALYDYEATCEGELSISVGDIITVTNINTGSSSWWEGTGPKGHGQFPSMYVQELTGNSKTLNSKVEKKTCKKVRALYDYTAQNPDELSFKAYDIIEVTEDTNNSNDWWMGRLNSQVGLFPRTYIEKI
jgi:flagellar hook-basal body complex protein FliE